MHKIKVIVAKEHKVQRGRVALIAAASDKYEVLGREGADILEEAFKLQPDLLVYELCSTGDAEYELLRKIKELCKWTKLIILTEYPINNEVEIKYLGICHGFIQNPILPCYLLKAMEVACFTNQFFFLGSLKGIKPLITEKIPEKSTNMSIKQGPVNYSREKKENWVSEVK